MDSKHDDCLDDETQAHSDTPHVKSFKGWKLIGGLCLLLATLFLIGWIPRYKQRQLIDANAAYVHVPQVTIMIAKSETKPIDLVLPSSAEALHITPLWARTNGYLARYLVDIGDHVKEGELLAEIDTPEVDQQLEQAIADLMSSEARMELAKITKERWEQLYKKNAEAVPGQEVDERVLSYKSSEADVLALEKNVKRLRYLKQFQKIYAPFDGIITKRDVDIGTLISAGSSGTNPQELFQIVETRIIRFFVEVPQTFFRQIHKGLKANIVIREFPEKNFEGEVVRFARALDPTARTMRTELHVNNPEGEILNGLYSEVTFKMHPEEDSFIVPADAVIIRADGTQIAILDPENKAHIKSVHIGRDFGKTMEVLEGLQENDRVIINPTEKIREGIQVNVVSEKSFT
ncbi:MAG: efflux transporter periplasmic adaptor subunit [Parachlamydia sp.]|nr:MAG: efflux transporter periplasmic adaptor subunit [Parachlamydia sp.]